MLQGVASTITSKVRAWREATDAATRELLKRKFNEENMDNEDEEAGADWQGKFSDFSIQTYRLPTCLVGFLYFFIENIVLFPFPDHLCALVSTQVAALNISNCER